VKASAEYIIDQIKTLDGSFPESRFLSQDHRESRYASSVEVLDGVSEEDLRAARIELSRSDRRETPSISEVYSACLRAQAEAAGKLRIKPAMCSVPRTPHRCAPYPEASSALVMVRMVSTYEAQHAMCQGEILATCWVCGARHGPVTSPLLLLASEKFPDETKGWNLYHKGYYACANCRPTSDEEEEENRE